jgi:undecaprenyl phosphate-alpha-L-ara4N flippase subunit ArnE
VSGASAVFAFITVILNGAAQLLLRQAAVNGATPGDPLTLLKSPWFMGGIAAYGCSVLTWMVVLRKVPLAVAAPFVALVYVLVPLASRVLYGDHVNTRMWVGMALVVLGVTLVAQGAPKAGVDAPVQVGGG